MSIEIQSTLATNHREFMDEELEILAKSYALIGGDILNVVKKFIAWGQLGADDLHSLCRQQLSQHTGTQTSQIGF